MTATPRAFASFDAAFALSFKEEIAGETFFASLAETEPDPRPAALWAKLALIEARTVAAPRPLATAMGLTPVDKAAVRREGPDEAADGQAQTLAEGLAARREGRADGRPGIATGGTIHGNPLSTAAALAMLYAVQSKAGYARISALGTRLSDGIDAMTAQRGLPWRAFRHGPRSGFCLTPALPRTAAEAAASMHRPFNAARRVFMANRGIWDAIHSAGPQVGFSHDANDIDRYLAVAAEFLDLVT